MGGRICSDSAICQDLSLFYVCICVEVYVHIVSVCVEDNFGCHSSEETY